MIQLPVAVGTQGNQVIQRIITLFREAEAELDNWRAVDRGRAPACTREAMNERMSPRWACSRSTRPRTTRWREWCGGN